MSKKGKKGKPSGPVNTKIIPPRSVAVKPADAGGQAQAPATKITSYKITLRIKSPFLFPGIAAGRYGVDRVGLRDRNRNLVIPQDQIKGVVRDALYRMGCDDLELKWFGKGSADVQDDDDNFAPDRGRVFFTDLVCKASEKQEIAHRVKIDKESGAAAEGHLMVIELAGRPGRVFDFVGEVMLVGDPDGAEEIVAAIKTALTVPLSIGAMKTVGFGRIVGTEFSPAAPRISRRTLPSARLVDWRFSVDRAYLVNASRVSENAFLGQADIPGGALKGTLAQTVRLMAKGDVSPEVDDYLSRMIVGTARPVGAKPAMALSIVYDEAGDGRFVNLAIAGQVAEKPILRLDWKGQVAAAEKAGFLGTNEATLHERVHTRIDRNTGGAEDEALFSTIPVLPVALTDPKLPSHLKRMTARLVLPEDTEMPLQIKAALESSVLPLGRTDAIVTTEDLAAAKPKAAPSPGRVTLRLVSDGLLADPYEDGASPDGTASARAAYRVFWKNCLPHSTLSDHFAEHKLIGGYQARRFFPSGFYRPWVLTKAGSVFVLNLAAEDVPALSRLLLTGLCRTHLAGVALSWRNCPFVSENGYGALDMYSPQEKDMTTW